ncbi:MAG: 50S ribosomal protein L6 [Candidatus Taylorbacteria bacterium]
MSRIAKKPIVIPAKTEVSFSGGIFTVKGPLGTLSKVMKPHIKILIENGTITLTPTNQSLQAKALWGTYAAHIKNMLAGVNKANERKLIIEGIGYKADVKGKDIVLALGFSHTITMPIPADLKVISEKNTVTISGNDLEKVSQFAAVIRALKKPEPYLGKGVRYSDEVIRRKQGKKAA